MSKLVGVMRLIFYHCPESVKLLLVRTVNNTLLFICAKR